MRAVLLIGPGGRWRLDYADSQGLAEGNDGERGRADGPVRSSR